jgi:dimeric dUTPase (all-alpha-NTP-PPase superfamily)
MDITNIFAKQRELMTNLEPIEKELGYSIKPVPLDFNLREHQDWFRLYSWYAVEELVEAMDACREDQGEELADALHFVVELALLADISPLNIMLASKNAEIEAFPPPASIVQVIYNIGLANNYLKAKHWKKNPAPPDLRKLSKHITAALMALLKLFEVRGLNAETEYFKKHEVNNQRIANNY